MYSDHILNSLNQTHSSNLTSIRLLLDEKIRKIKINLITSPLKSYFQRELEHQFTTGFIRDIDNEEIVQSQLFRNPQILKSKLALIRN